MKFHGHDLLAGILLVILGCGLFMFGPCQCDTSDVVSWSITVELDCRINDDPDTWPYFVGPLAHVTGPSYVNDGSNAELVISYYGGSCNLQSVMVNGEYIDNPEPWPEYEEEVWLFYPPLVLEDVSEDLYIVVDMDSCG